jgi:hypothetical protein
MFPLDGDIISTYAVPAWLGATVCPRPDLLMSPDSDVC